MHDYRLGIGTFDKSLTTQQYESKTIQNKYIPLKYKSCDQAEESELK